jgi:DNA-directed RNA polymerase subunit F
MAKMIFSKEETKNIMMMLQSEDADNHVIAFKTLQNVDFNKYVGELLVLYKFGGQTMENWMINCKKIATKLLDIKPETPLSSPKTLSLITKHKGSKASVELFMEFFIRDMSRMLESIGYPTDKFEINIKFKDDGQTTES